jgi:hypothetical protein
MKKLLGFTFFLIVQTCVAQRQTQNLIIITSDHGRGDSVKKEWTSHNNKIQDAHEMWMAVLGSDSPARGELKENVQLYRQQIAQTTARLMGSTYTAKHPIAAEIMYVFKMKK